MNIEKLSLCLALLICANSVVDGNINPPTHYKSAAEKAATAEEIQHEGILEGKTQHKINKEIKRANGDSALT